MKDIETIPIQKKGRERERGGETTVVD